MFGLLRVNLLAHQEKIASAIGSKQQREYHVHAITRHQPARKMRQILENGGLDGEIIAWTCDIAHWNDIGGMVPGSMAISATEIFQEGLRLPAVKIIEAGRPILSLIQTIGVNSRMPDYQETAWGRLEFRLLLLAADTAAEDRDFRAPFVAKGEDQHLLVDLFVLGQAARYAAARARHRLIRGLRLEVELRQRAG